MKRKRLLIGLGVAVVISAVALIVFRVVSKPKVTITAKDVATYINDENTRLNTLADSINSLKKLKSLNNSDQGSVGVLVITQGKKDDKLIGEIIEYLMKRDDSRGIEAAQVCYERAKTDDERTRCKNRAEEIAIKIGILKDGEKYPDNYFSKENKEQG